MYAYVAEARRVTFDEVQDPSAPPASDDDLSRASSQDELSDYEYDIECKTTQPKPGPDAHTTLVPELILHKLALADTKYMW